MMNEKLKQEVRKKLKKLHGTNVMGEFLDDVEEPKEELKVIDNLIDKATLAERERIVEIIKTVAGEHKRAKNKSEDIIAKLYHANCEGTAETILTALNQQDDEVK